jgi:hypothetical protein
MLSSVKIQCDTERRPDRTSEITPESRIRVPRRRREETRQFLRRRATRGAHSSRINHTSNITHVTHHFSLRTAHSHKIWQEKRSYIQNDLVVRTASVDSVIHMLCDFFDLPFEPKLSINALKMKTQRSCCLGVFICRRRGALNKYDGAQPRFCSVHQ